MTRLTDTVGMYFVKKHDIDYIDAQAILYELQSHTVFECILYFRATNAQSANWKTIANSIVNNIVNGIRRDNETNDGGS